jgi:hypothetical protein
MKLEKMCQFWKHEFREHVDDLWDFPADLPSN